MSAMPRDPEAWLASLLVWKLAGNEVPKTARECQVCGAMIIQHTIACQRDIGSDPSGLDCWNLPSTIAKYDSESFPIEKPEFVVADVLAVVEAQRAKR